MATQFKQPLSRPQAKAPRVRLEYPVTNFNGVDNSNDPASVNPNQSPDTLNTILDSIGAVEPRLGYTKLLLSKLPLPSNNGFPFYKSDGTKQLVYRAGQYLYRYDNAGGSLQVGGPFASSTNDDFDVYQDILYGVDGTTLYQYNGISSATALNPGTFASPQYIKVHKNRVWILQGSTLYFSDAGQPTSFPAGNFININTNDNQVGTGLSVQLDSLVVFKTDSVWYITGEPLGSGNSTVIGNLNLRRANSDVGCVAYRTIKQVESVIFFMARSGLYVLQNYASKRISDSVTSTFQRDMNPNAQPLSYALYSPVQKKYILGYTSTASGVPDRALAYDLILREFTLWDHLPGSWASNFRFNVLDSAVLGDNTLGNIYNLFSGYADIAGDNGTATAVAALGITTNLVLNPSLEVDTANWAATNVSFAAIARVTSDHYFGTAALQVTKLASSVAGAQFTTASLAANTTYTLSFYAKGTVAVTPILTTFAGSITTSTSTTLSGAWQRISFTFTTDGTAGAATGAVRWSGTTGVVYLDGVQVELGTTLTPYLDGSLGTGYAWTGTANNSTSTRSAMFTQVTDNTKVWTPDQFIDARVQFNLGTGNVLTGTVQGNTVTNLFITGLSASPLVNAAYTVGGYTSYWKSRIFDFDAPQMSKRYKYLNFFTDAEANYSLQVGIALDFANLSFNSTPLSLLSNTALWDQVGTNWDGSGVFYDTKGSLFKRESMPGTGRYVQIQFGNFNANQPWRVFAYSMSYKLKKARPT